MASADLPVTREGFAGLRTVVAGFGAAGFAAADNLLHLGAQVVVLEEDPDLAGPEAELLTVLGADVRRGPGETAVLPGDVDVLVVSPGWPVDAAVLTQARERDVAVWSDVELAWRVRAPEVPWLVVAAPDGDPGADEIAAMAAAVLETAGLSTAVLGPTGRPAVEAVMDPEPRDVLVAVVAASQLRDVHTLSAQAAVVLDAGTDPDLGVAYHRVQLACVYDLADPAAEEAVRDADVVAGARAVGITLGMPSISSLGVVEDLLADRAFVAERASSAAELATLADLADPADPAGTPPEPALVWHALAAAALTRAHGVSQAAVRDGLRRWSRHAG